MRVRAGHGQIGRTAGIAGVVLALSLAGAATAGIAVRRAPAVGETQVSPRPERPDLRLPNRTIEVKSLLRPRGLEASDGEETRARGSRADRNVRYMDAMHGRFQPIEYPESRR